MNKIAEFRKKNKLTQNQLAEKSGVSISYIQKIESGHKNNVSKVFAKSIADALNTTVEELFFSEEE